MINQYERDLFRGEFHTLIEAKREFCEFENQPAEPFARATSEILLDSGVLTDEPEFLFIKEGDYQIDAICWPDEDLKIVEVLSFIKSPENEAEFKDCLKLRYNKLKKFFGLLVTPTAVPNVPLEVEQLVRKIKNITPSPEAILLRFVTDTNDINVAYINRLKRDLETKFSSIRTDLRICGLDELAMNYSGVATGPSIEFTETQAVFCTQIHSEEDHDVYFAVFPAKAIGELFNTYGQRLLQKNVRSFLGMQKKNKKIRESILQTPGKFLSYNNGLTITTAGLQAPDNLLRKIENVQIVNGGQTTAVIAHETKRQGADFPETVKVAAKIICIKIQSQQNIWIDKIAETSNTQNAIKETDLSSQHPFFIALSELAKNMVFRRGTVELRHYFNRVRNQYTADFKGQKNNTERKNFQSRYPKNCVIEKKDIFRAEMVFNLKPHIAARGEAKSHVEFMKSLSDDARPDENWLRLLVTRMFILQQADHIAKQDGVKEGRSAIVEYACSIVSSKLSQETLNAISRSQRLSDHLSSTISKAISLAREFAGSLDDSKSIKEHLKQEKTFPAFQNYVAQNGGITDV